ncbi:MAG TPA: DoxX family protein [Ktedonobacteraceae bacterium]
MYIALWIVQILLALAFLMAGGAKTFTPIEKLRTQMGWARHATTPIVRLVGVLELAGAVGLILPAATKIAPWLTPLAAVGLVLAMIGAVIVHIRLNETKQITTPLVLLLLSLFIVVGYYAIVPVA